MSDRDHASQMTRRTFLEGAGALGAGAILQNRWAPIQTASAAENELPRRVLGKTEEKVSVLGLGTWPCGKCDTIGEQGVARIVNEALDLGINLIDAARLYDNAEAGIGKALGKRRHEAFLTTKVNGSAGEIADGADGGRRLEKVATIGKFSHRGNS